MRTKHTSRNSTLSWLRLKKNKPDKTIAQLSFADKVSIKTKNIKTFRRRDDVLITSKTQFYPPTQAQKGWYCPFTIVRKCKNDRVEVTDNNRWYAKVSTKELMHMKDYMEGLNARNDEPDPHGFKCI